MAEIRVRNAPAQLVKDLKAIAQELRQTTITGTIEKLIPRYHDMQTRIKEQNEEIGALARSLREEQHKYAMAQQDFANLLIDTNNFSKDLMRHLENMKRRYKTFGTKKRGAGHLAKIQEQQKVPRKNKPSLKK